MKLVIGLDIGSSSIKAALLDLESLTIRFMAARPFPAPIPGLPGRHEVNADEVLNACLALIDKVAINAAPDALLICGQHGGVVPVDRKTGKATGPYISWRDERTNEPHPDRPGTSFFNHERERLGEEQLLRVGREFAPGGTVAIVARLAREKRLSADTVFVGIGEYVLSQLTRSDAVIERTCAVGMADLRTLQPPVAIYEQLGISQFKWPRLVEFRDVVGHLKLQDRSIPAYPVVGDHQCALAGAALAERELSINVSTGSQVSLLVPTPEVGPLFQTRPFFDGLFLKTVTHLPAGRALNVLVDLLTELPRRAGRPIEYPWKILSELLEEPAEKSDLRVRTTFFKGPLGERGAIENISVNNLTAAGIMRAALQDMANNYRQAASWIGAEPSAKSFDSLVLSGGMAQKLSLLRDAIALEFANPPTRVSQSEEETMQGLMALALVNSGRAQRVVEAALVLKSTPLRSS